MAVMKCTIKTFMRGVKRFPNWVSDGYGWNFILWRSPYCYPPITLALVVLVSFIAAVIGYLACFNLIAWSILIICASAATTCAIYAMIRSVVKRCCELGGKDE